MLTSEKPGVILEGGKRIDVSAAIPDYDEAFFGGDGLDRLNAWLNTNAATAPTVADSVRLGPCVARPSKLICIGLNYAKHAKESNMDAPKEPIIFFKATSSIIGPNDTVIIPKNSRKSDWEVELAPLSSASARSTSVRKKRLTTSPATASTTTTVSANGSSNAAASG